MAGPIKQKPQPLQQQNPIVDPNSGKASEYFMRYIALHGGSLNDLDGAIESKADKVRKILPGVGLSGGGDLSADRTLDLANTAVTPGTYGSATKSAVITVDPQGRLTTVTEAPISGGGGSSGLISSVSVSAAVTTISFTGIPGTYKDLRLIINARCSTNSSPILALNLNSDTGGNYDYLRSNKFGSAAAGTATYFDVGDTTSSSDNRFTEHLIDLTNYTSSFHKNMSGRSTGTFGVGNITNQTLNGWWANTAAITRIDLTLVGGLSFDIGSIASLYGVG